MKQFKLIFYLHCLFTAMTIPVDSLPTSNSSLTTLPPDSSCTSHVTNVIVQGAAGAGDVGPQGERGESGPPGPVGPSGGGVSYTRWGRTVCPNGAETVYVGAVVGSNRVDPGTAEFLCLSNEPEFLIVNPGFQVHRGRLFGVEYESLDSPQAFASILHHDAPCSVCYSATHNTKITIPGRITCPPSWNREYYGYLMGNMQHVNHRSRVPICVDTDAESIAGSAARTLQATMYFLETTCTGIKCPPYSNGAEITCVVCTK